MIDDIPIQEKFEQAHLQVPASALPSNAAPRTMITVTASPRTVRTPVQPHTLAVTVCILDGLQMFRKHVENLHSSSLHEAPKKDPLV